MEIRIEDYNKVLKKRKVLRDVNLVLQGGSIYGFRGQNGCGKTMLMRAIIGLIRPTSGRVRINGKTAERAKIKIGILIENPSFLNELTGYANLKLLSDLQMGLSGEEIKNALTTVGLNPEDTRKYGAYSLGMRQKLGIAAAIMGEPELIILDEPINALDEESVKNISRVLLDLKSENRIIIIACHDREELEFLSDHVFMMEEGKVVAEYDVVK